MDPISIGATAVGVVKLTTKVVKGLWEVYEYCKSVHEADENVHELYSSVKQVTSICNLVETHVRLLPQDETGDHDDTDLLEQIDAQLSSCMAAVFKINSKIKRVRDGKTSTIERAIRKIWLDMSENDINESKVQIQACILNLQLSLQVVNLQATFIAPKIANQTLVEKITEIHRLLTTPNVDKDLQDCADTYIAKGTTLYEQSVASAAGGFASQTKPTAIAEWLENMQALRMDESSGATIVPEDDVSSPSISQETEETAPTLIQDPSSASICSPGLYNDDEDEFAVELVQTTIAAGRTFYAENKYQEAETRLKECLALMRRLSETHRRGYDFNEIHLLLSLCAFHLHDLATAEAALLSALERNTDTIAHATLQFEAGAALAVVYARLKKYDLAELNCENAYKGRRKLLGKEHETCYESLALLAYMYDLQDITARADTYRSMIPKDKQEALEQKCMELLQESDRQTKTDGKPNSQKLEDWTIKLDNNSTCFAISPESMTLAYGEPSESYHANIMLHLVETGKRVRTLRVLDDTEATRIAFSPSGNILASGHGGLWRKGFSRHYKQLSIRVWDISTGELIHWHTGSWGTTTNLCMYSLAFTLDGCRLISTHKYHRKASRKDEDIKPGLTVQDLVTGGVLQQFQNEDAFIRDISSNNMLILESGRQRVCLFSLKDYDEVGMYKTNFGGRIYKNNDIVLFDRSGLVEIWKQDDGSKITFETPKPASMQGVSMDSATMAIDTVDEIIIAFSKGEHVYIAAPQLGLWRAFPAQISGDLVWNFSARAEYLMYKIVVHGQYCIKVLNVQEQLKLAEKLPLPEVHVQNAQDEETVGD